MGLDMYLTKRHYVRNWDHMSPDELHQITITKGGKPTKIKPERITYIIEQVCQWRKANQIHSWFVANCQDGRDECQESYVEREKLVELLGIVTEVLASKSIDTAKEKLEPSAGFFFGSTAVDEGYWDDLSHTKVVLTQVLAEPDDNAEFFYSASW